MNRPELYKKTVDILYDAYFNDTLEHDNCYACAVGNIIAANCGFRFNKHYPAEGRSLYWDGHDPYTKVWPMNRDESVTLPAWYAHVKRHNSFNKTKAIAEVRSTGYSNEDLNKIEDAFENADYNESDDVWMFNGLVAVLEMLKKIHEVTDEPHTGNITRFKNHYQTK
jgi:hypothetical protein